MNIRQAVNPYLQVLLTYPHHIYSTVRGCWMVLLYAVVIIVTINTNVDLFPMVLFLSLTYYYCLLHIKEQFANVNARLIPNFRRVHVIISIGLLISLVIFFPAIITLLAGKQSVAIIAFCVCLFGIFSWVNEFRSGFLFWIMVVLSMPFINPNNIEGFFHGKHESLAFTLLIFGTLAAVLGGIRMFGILEEMPRNRSNNWDPWTGNDQNTKPEQEIAYFTPRCLQDWSTDRHITHLIHHALNASQSWWSRICRWQVGMHWIRLGFPFLFCLVYLLITSLHESYFDFIIAYEFSIIIPPVCMASNTRQFHRLSYEFLLPNSRTAYFRQKGIAIGIWQLTIWCIVNGMISLFFLIPNEKPYPRFEMIYMLAISAFYQFLIYGLFVSTARYRSLPFTGAVFIIFLFVAFIVSSALTSDARPGGWNLGPLYIAVIAALAGVLITIDAYRRWMTTDID